MTLAQIFTDFCKYEFLYYYMHPKIVQHLFGSSSDPSVLWVSLLEKGLAKFVGGDMEFYSSLDGGMWEEVIGLHFPY